MRQRHTTRQNRQNFKFAGHDEFVTKQFEWRSLIIVIDGLSVHIGFWWIHYSTHAHKFSSFSPSEHTTPSSDETKHYIQRYSCHTNYATIGTEYFEPAHNSATLYTRFQRETEIDVAFYRVYVYWMTEVTIAAILKIFSVCFAERSIEEIREGWWGHNTFRALHSVYLLLHRWKLMRI